MDEAFTGRKSAPGAPAPGSDLERLVDLEDRIARDLARVESEAVAILEDARRTMRGDGSLQAGLMEKEAAALLEQIETDCRRRIETIDEEARRAIERFERAGSSRLEELAARAVERLLGTRP